MVFALNILDTADPICKLLGDWAAHIDLWSIILRIVQQQEAYLKCFTDLISIVKN